jgi:hypothetical protein
LEELKIYFVKEEVNGQTEYPNKNLEISHSFQFVFAYDWLINNNLHFKAEPYFQQLYNIPGIADSSYSMINFTQDWTFRNSLVNNSVGKNYGVDFTFERFLNKGYYFLLTTSVFRSEYKGDDGIWRKTKFDKGYVANLLFGKEFTLRNNRIFGINGRFNFMGGDRFSPVDIAKSEQEKSVIYDETKAYSVRSPATQYIDLTLTYRINKQRHSSVWALQVKNVLGAPMYGGYSYYYKTGEILNEGVVVILPVLSYKLEF